MKKSLSPGVIVLIIAVIVIVIGLIYTKMGGPGAKQNDIEKQIAASRASVTGKMPTAPAPVTK